MLKSLPVETTYEYSSPDESYIEVTKYIDRVYIPGLVPQIVPNDLWENTFLYNGQVDGKPSPTYVRQRLQKLRRGEVAPLERQEVRLIHGAVIASKIIKNILRMTGYQSSIGIGSNKSIAKIGSGLHKPGSITVLAPAGLEQFAEFVKIDNIPTLGGKLGNALKQDFNIETMLELQRVRHLHLARVPMSNNESANVLGYEKATEILNKAYGLCRDLVDSKKFAKTATVSHQFYGKLVRTHWFFS